MKSDSVRTVRDFKYLIAGESFALQRKYRFPNVSIRMNCESVNDQFNRSGSKLRSQASRAIDGNAKRRRCEILPPPAALLLTVILIS